MPTAEDNAREMIKQEYGRWQVLGLVGYVRGKYRVAARCLDCNQTHQVIASALRASESRRCVECARERSRRATRRWNDQPMESS